MCRDEIGDGELGRLLRDLQRRYFTPPTPEQVYLLEPRERQTDIHWPRLRRREPAAYRGPLRSEAVGRVRAVGRTVGQTYQ
jgi:hypothetical protein